MSEQAPPPPSTPPKPAAPAAPAAPPGRTIDEIKRDPLVAAGVDRSGDAILDAKEFAGEITLFVDRDRIVEVCRAFKDDGYNYLVDLCGIDYSKYPSHGGLRFSVAYTLYSFQKNARIRLRVWTDDKWPVPSVSSVWKTANWHERETYDMFGISFSGHPNLERILMWEGFNGFPLRKDFPIRGIDTGARIYPEVFPEGGGPKPGSTGKPAADVNIFQGEWPSDQYGRSPIAQIGGAKPAAPAVKAVAAAPPKPAAAAPSTPAAAPPAPTAAPAAAGASSTDAAAPPAPTAAPAAAGASSTDKGDADA